MNKPRFLRWLMAGALSAGALALGCTYSPNFASGSLKCSTDGQCPDGYTCKQPYCCRSGDATCGGPSAATIAAYLGTWKFTSAATLDTECSGTGSSNGPAAFLTSANPVSTMALTDNGDGTLHAVWSEWSGCSYTLSLDNAGAHGADAATWACEQQYSTTSTNPPQISKQLWIYDSFDIVTTDGKSATHDGVYYREDTYNDNSVVYCTQTLHAPLTK